jgi:hypothetical protein
MFIERASSKTLLRCSGAKCKPDYLVSSPEALRSAGARVVVRIGFYKHLAPLEPEHYLVEA